MKMMIKMNQWPWTINATFEIKRILETIAMWEIKTHEMIN